MTIFNRNQLRLNQIRVQDDFDRCSFFHNEIAARMIENIDLMTKKDFKNILELGIIKTAIKHQFTSCQITKTSNFYNKKTNIDIVCDDELLPFKNNVFDLVFSNLNMQFINEIPQFLLQVKEVLKPNGVFIASFFGEENLRELNHAMQLSENEIYGGISPRLPPTIDVKTAAMLLQKSGFKNPVSSLEKIIISYKEPLSLLKDLKNMALGNILCKKSQRFFSGKLLQRLIENYQNLCKNENGEIQAQFEVIIISGQK